MSKTHERTKRMMEGFIEQRSQGKTIEEIAKIYEITSRTIYNKLQEIADANGVSRESLLEAPHKEHIMEKSPEYDRKKRVDAIQLQESFEKMISEADNIINAIDAVLTSENEQEEK